MNPSEFWTQAATIVGPILVTFVVGLKMTIKSIDSRFESLSAALRAVNIRCAQNHPTDAPKPNGGTSTSDTDWIDEVIGG